MSGNPTKLACPGLQTKTAPCKKAALWIRSRISRLFRKFMMVFRRSVRQLFNYKGIKIKICITTNASFSEKTVPPLVSSLLQSGIKEEDIFVFEGGNRERGMKQGKINYYLCDHNCFDLTSLVEITERRLKTDYWLLLHDTCLVGKNFKKLAYNIPLSGPEVVSLTDFPSMNIAAYKYSYLLLKRNFILSFKNKDYSEEAMQRAKRIAVENEDSLYLQAKVKSLYNTWRKCEAWQDKDSDALTRLADIYSSRKMEYYPQLDLYKFKANWIRKDKYFLGFNPQFGNATQEGTDSQI